MTARLVSRFGAALRDLSAARGADNVYEIDLPLASLAAGMLGLWIAVPLAAGARQFRRKDF